MSERFIYKHVVVVGLDGMGIFNKKANTPCMDKIFENELLCGYAPFQCYPASHFPHLKKISNGIM